MLARFFKPIRAAGQGLRIGRFGFLHECPKCIVHTCSARALTGFADFFEMEFRMNPIGAVLWLVGALLDLVLLVLIINMVLSWLFAFDLVGRGNRFVNSTYEATQRLVAPILGPIRRVIPPVGGIDFSPMVVFFGVLFLKQLFPGL
jgi:YggT family protein